MQDRAEAWPETALLRDLAATPVMLLAVGPLAQRAGWAARAAISIAEEFGARGERTVLVDLSLDRPELHELLGVDSTEGLTDVFLFGASREHVTLMLPAHAFELIPASAYTPDAEEILTHPRWSKLFEECAASQTRLLLYVPVDTPGVSALSDRVGDTIVLADAWEADEVRSALAPDAHILSTLTPPQPESEPEPEPEPLPLPEPEPEAGPSPRLTDKEFEKIRVPRDGAREALIADLRNRQRNALMAPAPTVAPLTEAEIDIARARPAPPLRVSSGFPPTRTGIHEPTFASTVRAKPVRPRRTIPLLIVLLLVSSAAAGWHYWGRGALGALGASRAERASGATGAQRTNPQSPQSPQSPQGPTRPLPYSVAVATYQVLALAQERVDQLADQQGTPFYIAPTVVQGSLFYRVLAGPLPDSAAAVAVRDTLIARKIKTFSSGTDVLATPYAFLLGSFENRSQAQARMDDVAKLNIPSYIVMSSAPDGAARYILYAGAYTGRGDAEFMRGILNGASLPDTLVERTGSIRS